MRSKVVPKTIAYDLDECQYLQIFVNFEDILVEVGTDHLADISIHGIEMPSYHVQQVRISLIVDQDAGIFLANGQQAVLVRTQRSHPSSPLCLSR